MKREQRREHTKKQILEATKEMIRQQGMRQDDYQNIMDRTGFPKARSFTM